MKLYLNQNKFIDTSEGIDISIPIQNDAGVRAWYVSHPKMEPVRGDGFVGLVEAGGNVNFRNIAFNPHGHGTHTECVGHISKEIHSVNQSLNDTFFNANLISVQPQKIHNTYYKEDDLVILEDAIHFDADCEALIIRTLPNSDQKKVFEYSGTNPPYLSEEAIQKIAASNIKHLLIDLPSVDREVDEGVLNAHHIFWDYPATINLEKTITEMIFVPTEIEDGNYILNLQVASFENDASPSKPLLYKLRSEI